MIDNQPDLPYFESVNEKGLKGLLVNIIFLLLYPGIMIGMFIWFYRVSYAYLGEDRSVVLAGIFIMLALCIWLAIRLLSAPICIQTGPEGIALISVLRRKLIRWSDVEKAMSVNIGYYSRRLDLYVGRSRAIISRQHMSNFPSLQASVWQYLRRVGKAEELRLSEEVKSFWDEIPIEVPRVVQWEKAPHPALVERLYWSTANKVIMNEESINLTLPSGSVSLAWNDIQKAFWEGTRIVGNLILSVDGRKRYKIPFFPSDLESCKLILAIIRRLREVENAKPLTVPWELRDLPLKWPKDSVNTTDKAVSIHYSIPEYIIMSALFLILLLTPALIMLDWYHISPILILLSLAGVLGFICYAASTYTLCANYEEISWRFLRKRKSIKWSNLTDCILEPHLIGSQAVSLILRSSDGMFIDYKIDIGSPRDRQRLLRYIRARVLEVLPEGRSRDMWKTRPWASDDTR